MKNLACTISSSVERAQIMQRFPDYLNNEEEALVKKYFEPIVFFETLEKNVRRCVCTSCGGYTVDRAINPEYFSVTHNTKCECKYCGQRAIHVAMGKYRNYVSLKSHVNAVQVRAYEEGLFIQAGWAEREFDDEDLCGTIDFNPFKRVFFSKDGRAVMWKRNHYCDIFGEHTSDEWEKMESIREPFQHQMGVYGDDTSYALLGFKAIFQTQFKYCMFAEWFDDAFGGMLGGTDFEDEPFFVSYFIKYLAEYSRRPQMEMLAKFGHMDVITDLIRNRKQNGDILNWRAKDPAGFFRLSKADYRDFRDNGIGWQNLKAYRKMLKGRRIGNIKEFTEAKKRLGNEFDRLIQCAEMAGVNLKRAENYIRSFQGGCHHGRVPLSRVVTIWRDYLTAAVALKYDLKRDDVRMPKDLNERHDSATAAAQMKTSENYIKKYKKRYEALDKQFSFAHDGLMIAVPPDVDSIVTEGRVLEHCVGGYADRHVNGKLIILFLRREETPEESYVTIELPEETNCKKIEVRQIHGYDNERGGGRSPGVIHKEFLDTWLGWIREGSPRDKDGNPVIKKAEERKTA